MPAASNVRRTPRLRTARPLLVAPSVLSLLAMACADTLSATFGTSEAGGDSSSPVASAGAGPSGSSGMSSDNTASEMGGRGGSMEVAVDGTSNTSEPSRTGGSGSGGTGGTLLEDGGVGFDADAGAVADGVAGGAGGSGGGTGASGNGGGGGTADGDGDCEAETDEEFCSGLFAECGGVRARDNCQAARDVDCGSCPIGECQGNVCICEPETAAEFCSRHGKQCGLAGGLDNCETPRTFVQCGACESGVCGADNVCCSRDTNDALECPGTEVLAQGQGGPSGIAVDDTQLFWTNTTDGTVMRSDHDGGNAAAIAFGQGNPVALALSDAHVYWTASDVTDPLGRISGERVGVRRVLKGGGQVAVAAVSPHAAFTGVTFDLVYVNEEVYWTERINSAVDALIMAPIAASAGLGTDLVTNYTEPQTMRQTLATDGTSIVWAVSQDVFSDAGAIFRADVGATNATKIFNSSLPIGGIDILSGLVFFPNARQDTSSPTEAWEMKELSIGGGAPTSYSIPQEHTGLLGWDEGVRCRMLPGPIAVLAINGGGGPSWMIETLSLDTGESKYVADVDGGLGDFVVAGDRVYWTEPTTGRVLRAAL